MTAVEAVASMSQRDLLDHIDRVADERRRRIAGGFVLDLPRFDLPFDIALLNKMQLYELLMKSIPQFVLQVWIHSVTGAEWQWMGIASLAVTSTSLGVSLISGWSLFRRREWASTFKAMKDPTKNKTVQHVTGVVRGILGGEKKTKTSGRSRIDVAGADLLQCQRCRGDGHAQLGGRAGQVRARRALQPIRG